MSDWCIKSVKVIKNTSNKSLKHKGSQRFSIINTNVEEIINKMLNLA